MNYIYVNPNYYCKKEGRNILAPKAPMAKGVMIILKVAELLARKKDPQEIQIVPQVLAGEYKNDFCLNLYFDTCMAKNGDRFGWFTRTTWMIKNQEVLFGWENNKKIKKIKLQNNQTETLARALIHISKIKQQEAQERYERRKKTI